MRAIDIEVVYVAPAGEAQHVSVRVLANQTVQGALEATTLWQELRTLPFYAGAYAVVPTRCLGVFGQHRTLDAVLAPGDRIEIYAPLQCDPKAARLARVVA